MFIPVSNVVRATLLEDEENDFEQIVYYQAGVGADAEVAGKQSLNESV